MSLMSLLSFDVASEGVGNPGSNPGGNLARLGRLPRTRPIVPGELAVSD